MTTLLYLAVHGFCIWLAMELGKAHARHKVRRLERANEQATRQLRERVGELAIDSNIALGLAQAASQGKLDMDDLARALHAFGLDQPAVEVPKLPPAPREPLHEEGPFR